LVSFGKRPSIGQASWVNCGNLSYHATEFPLEWMQDVQAGIGESAKYLSGVVESCRPDVLHLSQFCYGALECGVPKVVVAHSDVRSWWNAVHGDDPPRSAWMDWYTEIVSRGLSTADAVVAPSRWMMSALQTHYELPRTTRVIYNGRSQELFRAAERKSDSVLSVGRIWDEAKQVRLLLERPQSVPVRIAGSIRHPEKNFSQEQSLQHACNFIFYGEQDDQQLCQLYADSSTYAATSRYEPFGLAPVEAALSRCALIANDIPVFRELWGNAAFYFRRDDPDSLAQAIRLFSEFPSVRRRLADMAYERARTNFESQRMVTEYEDLYRTLTGERGDA
jgi:glycosyltransferase involved in cell wall biosynthesis